METSALKKIADNLPIVADYSLMGGGVAVNNGGVEPLLPTGVVIKK
jgi:hypothetical protein